MSFDYSKVFFLSPPVFLYVRVQVVVPPFSALFSNSTRQVFGDKAPVFGSVLAYKPDDKFVLFFGLDKGKNYPGAFDEFGVEDFLPSVEALDVGSLLKKSSNSFPISGSILINELFEFLVFFLGPPAFFDVLIFLGIVGIDHL